MSGAQVQPIFAAREFMVVVAGGSPEVAMSAALSELLPDSFLCALVRFAELATQDSGRGGPKRADWPATNAALPRSHQDERDMCLPFTSRLHGNFRWTARDFAPLRWHQGCALPWLNRRIS